MPAIFANLDIANIDIVELGAFNHSAVNYLSSPLIYLPFFVTAIGRNRKDLISKFARPAQTKFEKIHSLPNIAGSLIENNASDSEKEWLEAARSCLLYTSPSPRDKRQSRMPSSA